MPAYVIDGLVPVVDPQAFVHPTAVLIGDVIVGAGCYIGPGASLRGDFGRIVLEAGANLQDTCVMHGFPRGDTVLERDGHVSHGAVLHGCRIGRNTMVGINAVVMDEAVIGADCLIAALSYVRPAFTAAPRSVIAGAPAVIKRPVSDEELAWKREATAHYQRLAQRCHTSLREVTPLPAPEPDRRRLDPGDFAPLHRRR